MTITIAIIAGVAIALLGYVLVHLILERKAFAHLLDLYNKQVEVDANLQEQNDLLREHNRKANKISIAEKRELRGKITDARVHAEQMQEFHLNNERDLQLELSGAHALIEILIDRVPKTDPVEINIHEAQRIFGPITAMRTKTATLHHPNIF